MEKYSHSLSSRRGGRSTRSLRGFSKRVSAITKGTARRISEVKYTTYFTTGYSIFGSPNTWIMPLDFLIQPGFEKDDHIGRSVQYKFLTVNIALWAVPNNISFNPYEQFSYCKLVLFQTRLPLSAAPTTAEVNSLFDTTSSTTVQPLVTLKPNSVRILDEEIVPLSSIALSTVANVNFAQNSIPSVYTFKFKHKVNNHVNFNHLNNNTSADPKDKYYVLIVGHSVFPIATTHSNMQYSLFSRLSYTDL